MTRGEKVIAFIQKHCRVPEGVLLGRPVRLLDFQKKFILDVYDNPAGTSRAYLSIARKNAKTATIAMILLAHIVGPEAFENSRIISGARSRKQAAEVYNYAAKMVMASPELRKIVKTIPSQKILIGLLMNVEYQAIAAEAKGAHGGSPIVAILDEVGQVRGPYDPFIEAIETAQGAYEGRALLIAISTQAPTAADLFSIWLDDARNSQDPHIVCHVHSAPPECDLMDRDAWRAANPALGIFRSLTDVEEAAERAARLPTAENTFRWLFLNQRVEANSPFVSKGVWAACGSEPLPLDGPVYGGLDLSAAHDLTALVLIGQHEGVWQVHPTFWLPGDGLGEKSRADRVPYDVWERQGHLIAAPGKAIEYEYVAAQLVEVFENHDVRKIAFDRWGWRHLRTWLLRAGFTEQQLEEHFAEMGQGYQSMSPALRDLETDLLNGNVAHGNHPVLTMCAANAVVQSDPAGNRKLAKDKSAGRIDGMVALAMARAAAAEAETEIDIYGMVA
jgi:phage terminase large subunit-like protein